MHGSQVWEVFLQGGLKRIRDYCETDVLNTYLIYLRFELLRGHLNALEHAHEVARVRQACCTSRRPRTSRNFRPRGPRLEAPAGQLEEADVVDLAHDGRGIARSGGKAVFIEGALPGERVRFRVLKRRRQWMRRGWSRCSSASPDRVVPRCAHFGVCGGCSLQHLAPAAQLAAKERQLLDNLRAHRRRAAAARVRSAARPDFGYRRRARLGVKYVHKKGRVLAGFRERDKPYVADLRRCEILLERFATLPADLAALVETLSLREKLPQVETGRRRSRRRRWCFGSWRRRARTMCSKLERFGARLGVQIYLQSGGLETIRPLAAAGSPLTYALDGGRLTLEFGPADFIQINREVNIAMVSRGDRTACSPGPTIRCSICSAAWAISPCRWAAAALRVVGVEATRRWSPRRGPMPRATASPTPSFFADNLFEPARFGPWAETAYDLVLLDPPRAGAACNHGTHGTVAAPASRVYFLPSGEFGAGCRHFGASPRVPADRRRGHGYVSAYDARRIDRGVRERRMSLGPLMVDIAGTELTADDIEVLRHPLVGSVLLFSRNYRNPQQLAALTRRDSGAAHAASADRRGS